MIITQVLDGFRLQEIELFQLFFSEAEIADCFQHSRRASDDAVAALSGQAPGENLEGDVAVGGAVGKRGFEHRQLVFIC